MNRTSYIFLVLACLAILWVSALPAWGQYSSADCTGPLVPGSGTILPTCPLDMYPNCTQSILFSGNPLPAGADHMFFVESRPEPAPNDPHFFIVPEPNLPSPGLWAFMNDELEIWTLPDNPYYIFASAGLGSDACVSCNQSLPIRSCPTAYGRFFDIDSDGDGVFDDMEVVFLDGTAVPVNFRILFVPLNWTGNQAQFDTAAQDQINMFANSTTLGGCMNTIEHETLDVTTQNFNTFTCNNRDCRIRSIRDFLRDIGFNAFHYDVVAGLLPSGASPCPPASGCSNGIDTIWVVESSSPILAHEIGHIYGLEDEYCSEESGGDQRCAGSGDLNFLGADLGCDPNTGMGCCTCPTSTPGADACSQTCDPANVDNYFLCCDGNDGALGGKCIMAAVGSGWPTQQNWCQRCLNRLNGQTEFACDNLPSDPFEDVLAVELTISEDGGAQVTTVEMGRGRPTRTDIPGDRFQIMLDTPSGNLLNESFGFLTREIEEEEVDFYYKVPVDFPIDTPPPVILTLWDSGIERLRVTLFGTAPVADAGEDTEAECTSGLGVEVTLDGSGSYDTDGDMLSFNWSVSGIVFDDPTSETPTAQFPVGDTSVTLVVSDGVFESSDTVIVRVVDTTAPVITLNGPSEMTLECHVDSYTEMGAIVSDICDTELTTPTIGGDTVDVNVPGTYTITYDAVDASGNAATQVTRIVTVVDTLPPTITCPANKTIECDQSTDPANTGSATSTDICDSSPAITFSDTITPGQCPEEFTITRTWTATDVSRNSSSCVQTIEVEDTNPPVIACNSPATITPPDAPISFTATSTDNCDSDPAVTITQFDCFKFTQKGKRIDKTESCVVQISGNTITIQDAGGVGDHITWTVQAEDNCGNTAQTECEVEVVKP